VKVIASPIPKKTCDITYMLLLSKTVKKKQDFDVHNKKGYKKNKGMKMSFFNVEL